MSVPELTGTRPVQINSTFTFDSKSADYHLGLVTFGSPLGGEEYSKLE